MAFVSQLKQRLKTLDSVKFRRTKSGAGGGYLSKGIPLRGKRIDIQIDEETKAIRIGEFEEGVACNYGGTFSCSINVFNIIGENPVELTESEDGWWYGKY